LSVITYEQAKTLILERLNQQAKQLPESEKQRPRFIVGNMKTLSILDLIAEIERDTELGRAYVNDQVKQLGYAVS
jgi:hypothetical protein